jgi:hypothetical protein
MGRARMSKSNDNVEYKDSLLLLVMLQVSPLHTTSISHITII